MSTVNKLMIGMAVGAIFGVLYAPDRGSVTRRKLSRTGKDLKDAFNDFKEAVNDKIDKLKEDVDDLAYEEMEMIETEAADANTSSWQPGT